MRYIFLSYAHENAAFALKLANDLKLEEIAVWIDYKDINVGDSFLREIDKMLQKHDYFIPILSPEYFKSQWCMQELRSAFVRSMKEGIALLPVLYRDCSLPPLLSDRLYADFRQDYELGLLALIDAIRGIRRLGPVESLSEDLIVGGFIAKSNPEISFDGKTFTPWIAVCPEDIPEDQWAEGSEILFDHTNQALSACLEVEFDLTNQAMSTLRITDILVEVENWEPITQPINKLQHWVGGVAEPRYYFCRLEKLARRYPCQLLTPSNFSNQHGCYIKLTEREMELFKLNISTSDEGIYDLNVIIIYSMEGKAKETLAGSVRGCVAHDWLTYSEIRDMSYQRKLPGKTS